MSGATTASLHWGMETVSQGRWVGRKPGHILTCEAIPCRESEL